MFVLSPALHDILHTSMARYSLFVLKELLNTKQTNTQASKQRQDVIAQCGCVGC